MAYSGAWPGLGTQKIQQVAGTPQKLSSYHGYQLSQGGVKPFLQHPPSSTHWALPALSGVGEAGREGQLGSWTLCEGI